MVDAQKKAPRATYAVRRKLASIISGPNGAMALYVKCTFASLYAIGYEPRRGNLHVEPATPP
jgi:hypothetical protein